MIMQHMFLNVMSVTFSRLSYLFYSKLKKYLANLVLLYRYNTLIPNDFSTDNVYQH